jgi:hypothetical protein
MAKVMVPSEAASIALMIDGPVIASATTATT